MKNRKRTILYLLLLVCFLPSFAWGIMAVNDNGSNLYVQQTSSTNVQQANTLLLAWNNNFLQTSKGTISTIGVKIVDHSDIDRRELSSMKKLPVIKFTTKDNQVIQVDIYPPR